MAMKTEYPSIQRLRERLLRTEEEVHRVLAPHRAAGKTIVSTNGCFDLLHLGHLHILTEAAAQGDVLIVGLNSDASVRALKGSGRPVIPQLERAEVLLSFEMVDYVVLFEEPECLNFVRMVRPDVHANDATYGEDCIEAPLVREGGGKLHLVSKISIPSTTDLISRMRQAGS